MATQSPTSSAVRVPRQGEHSGRLARGADVFAMHIAVAAVFMFVGLLVIGLV